MKTFLKEILEKALQEDIGSGDITTDATFDSEKSGRAQIVAKQDGILAGIQIAAYVFELLDPALQIKQNFNDGYLLNSGNTIMEIEGRVAPILKGERVALNFLCHLSGVATLTREFVDSVKGTRARISDTRKTTPLLRAMEKEAVIAGGGFNHRMGLYDMVLIKENHIRAAGSITRALAQTRRFLADMQIVAKIEVETTNPDEVREALSCGVDRIMLDNMTIEEMREAVRLINRQTEVEASGGVNLKTVRDIAETGIDLISVGAITHSAPAFDFSLLLKQ